jgi:hypothetical protein
MDKPEVKVTGNTVEVTVSKHTLIDIAIAIVAAGIALYIVHRVVAHHMK